MKKRKPVEYFESIPQTRIVVFLFLIVFLLNSAFGLFLKVPIISDENGTIFNAFFLSGIHNWADAYSSSLNMYWGYGYAALWIPLLYFLREPVVQYKGIMIFNSAIIGLIPVFASMIMMKYFPWLKKKDVIIISAFVSLFPSNFAFSKNAWNEPMLILLQWIFLWLLLRMIHEDKVRNRRIFSFFLSLLSIYAYSVHGRGIGFIGASLFILLCFCIKDRKLYLSIPMYVIGFVPSYFLQKLIKSEIVSKLLQVAPGSARNTSESIISKNMLILFENNNFAKLFLGMAGQFFYVTLATFGFVTLGMLYWLYLMRKKNKLSDQNHRPLTQGNRRNLIAVGSFSVVLFFSTLVISSIFYYKTYITNQSRGIEYFLYGRYNEVASGTLVFFAIVAIWSIRAKTPVLIAAVVQLCVSVAGLFLVETRFIQASNVIFNPANMYTFVAIIPMLAKGEIQFTWILASVGILLAISSCIWILAYKRKYAAFLAVIVLVFQYISIQYYYEYLYNKNDQLYSSVDEISVFYNEMNKTVPVKADIYLTDVSTRTTNLQFYLQDNNTLFLNIDSYGYQQLGFVQPNSFIISNRDEKFDIWLSDCSFLTTIDNYNIWVYGDYLKEDLLTAGYVTSNRDVFLYGPDSFLPQNVQGASQIHAVGYDSLNYTSDKQSAAQSVFPGTYSVSVTGESLDDMLMIARIDDTQYILPQETESVAADRKLFTFTIPDGIGEVSFVSCMPDGSTYVPAISEVKTEYMSKSTVSDAYKKVEMAQTLTVNHYQTGLAISHSDDCIQNQTYIMIRDGGYVQLPDRTFLPHGYSVTVDGTGMELGALEIHDADGNAIPYDVIKYNIDYERFQAYISFAKEYTGAELRFYSLDRSGYTKVESIMIEPMNDIEELETESGQ